MGQKSYNRPVPQPIKLPPPMTAKTITRLLVLSAVAMAGANSALADGGGFRDGGGFHGRGHHWTRPPVIVGGFVGLDGYGGYGNGGSYGTGYGDWYGISSGHDDCPLFRKRVLTPQGWQFQMIPIC